MFISDALPKLAQITITPLATHSESHQQSGSDAIADEWFWVGGDTTNTAVTTTDAVLYGLHKRDARNTRTLLKYYFDTLTGTPTLTQRFLYGNKAAGLTPTAVGWDTPPTNLQNACDEALYTETGLGEDNDAIAINTCYVQIDLGQPYDGYFLVKRYFAYWQEAGLGTGYLAYQVSANGTDWTTLGTQSRASAQSYTGYWWNTTKQTGVRYLRISGYSSDPGGNWLLTFSLAEWCFLTILKQETYTLTNPTKIYAHRIDNLPNMFFATGVIDAGATIAHYQLHSAVKMVG